MKKQYVQCPVMGDPRTLKGLKRSQCGKSPGMEGAWGTVGLERRGEARPHRPCSRGRKSKRKTE